MPGKLPTLAVFFLSGTFLGGDLARTNAAGGIESKDGSIQRGQRDPFGLKSFFCVCFFALRENVKFFVRHVESGSYE